MQGYMDHLLRSDIERALEDNDKKEREAAKRRHPSNYKFGKGSK
jgi:hypothetical protein